MKPMQKKALVVAVAAGLGCGAAEAVYKNPEGTGQVLIYPYYTVQQVGGKSMNTLISVVNTTSQAKVVKVRFREGKGSVEVLDFNLYLSPNDVWTAAVIPDSATDTTSGGKVISSDKSCTNPALPSGGVTFRNLAYASDTVNGNSRSREGYLEILEFATLTGTTATNVTHLSTGVPANCAAVQTANGALPSGDIAPPTGGLAGTGTIINVAQGSDIGYNAVAFADWRFSAYNPTLADETFNLTDGGTFSATVNTANLSSGYRDTPVFVMNDSWATASPAVDAFSSTIMATNVINEFILESSTLSNTDWVLTFPTKRYYVGATAARPFTKGFSSSTGACEPITLTYFDREEKGATASGSDFSPSPPATTSTVCWESTIVSFRSGQAHNPTGTTSAVLGSTNTTSVTVGTFQNGWANINFGASAHKIEGPATSRVYAPVTSMVSPSSVTYFGLPVVGFMARSYTNTSAGTCDVVPCNYNSSFEHKYRTTLGGAYRQ